jgi:hypothetical protein
VTDHRLYDPDRNSQFDHVGDESMPEIMKPETVQSSGRKAPPGTIPVLPGLIGVVTSLAFASAVGYSRQIFGHQIMCRVCCTEQISPQ